MDILGILFILKIFSTKNISKKPNIIGGVKNINNENITTPFKTITKLFLIFKFQK